MPERGLAIGFEPLRGGDSGGELCLTATRRRGAGNLAHQIRCRSDMLVAKGYGSADPIASNDTPEGRKRNRRIEYHIVKTPT